MGKSCYQWILSVSSEKVAQSCCQWIMSVSSEKVAQWQSLVVSG